MPDAKRLDVAVAELTRDTAAIVSDVRSTVQVDGVRPVANIAPSNQVFFYGKESGAVEAEVQHATIWDTVEIHGVPHCFGELFTLTPPKPYYLNQDLCRDGDSGSWIVADEEGTQWWYGMLIAGDGVEAYGCFAEYIVDACRASGLSISL